MAERQPPLSAGATSATLEAQLKRVRLESETLYRIVRVIAGSAEVPQVLAGVVDLLTEATNCHACLIYLREGDQLRLRGASRSFSQLIDQVQIPVGEGLVGWSMRNRQPALVRENALDDPRFHFVPELEEESFQSIAAIAIPARQGPPIGAISLHNRAPHEFDDEIVTFLVHTASLLAGAIETAQLYEEASHRVETLTRLGRISEQIAATDSRESLYETVVTGIVDLLPCIQSELLEVDPSTGELSIIATAGAEPDSSGVDALHAAPSDETFERLTAPIVAGEETLGELRAVARASRSSDSSELLGAIANQTAVSLKRAELIERLTEEYVTRDLFDALLEGKHDRARATARKLRLDLESEYLVIRAVPIDRESDWGTRLEALEDDLRELSLRSVADVSNDSLTALIATSARNYGTVLEALDRLASRQAVIIGISEAHHGPGGLVDGLAEATDAASVAQRIEQSPTAQPYRDLGAYRYLVRLPLARIPRDLSWREFETLAAYDRRRQTHLIETLERCLEQRGSVSSAAEQLHVHPNTVRQRLDRIGELTSIDLADDNLLALEVALKLFRLTASAS